MRWLPTVALAVVGTTLPAIGNDKIRAMMEASVSRQQESIAKMQASIEKQQRSISSQPRTAGFNAPLSSAIELPVVDPCAQMTAQEIDPLVHWAAQREGLQPALLRAVMARESAFRPCAVSSKGAMGLMQLMPGTASDFGVQDPFDPVENVGSGAAFLAQLLRRYGNNPALALGAYNAGPGRVDASGGVPPFPETLRYVSDILAAVPLQ